MLKCRVHITDSDIGHASGEPDDPAVLPRRSAPAYDWIREWVSLTATAIAETKRKNHTAPTVIILSELSRFISLMRKVLKINCNVLENIEAGSFEAAVH